MITLLHPIITSFPVTTEDGERGTTERIRQTKPARRQHGCQSERDEEGEERRGRDHQAELPKVLANDPGHERDRRVDDDVNQSYDNCREPNLRTALQGGSQRRLAQLEV